MGAWFSRPAAVPPYPTDTALNECSHTSKRRAILFPHAPFDAPFAQPRLDEDMFELRHKPSHTPMLTQSPRPPTTSGDEKAPLLKQKRKKRGKGKRANAWTPTQILHFNDEINDMHSASEAKISAVARKTGKTIRQVKKKLSYLLHHEPSSEERERQNGRFSGVLIDDAFNMISDQIHEPDTAISLAVAVRNVLAPLESWTGVHNPKDKRKGKFAYARAEGNDAERALYSVLDETNTHIIEKARKLASKWARTQVEGERKLAIVNSLDRPRDVSACLYEAKQEMGLAAHVDSVSVCTVVIGLTRDVTQEGTLTFLSPPYDTSGHRFLFVPGRAVVFGPIKHEVPLAVREHDRVTLNVFF